MAKTTGPLFSLAASGTFRGAIVFRTRQGATYAGGLPKITAARSAAQLNHSIKVAELNAAWSILPPATQTAWGDCGASFNLRGHQLWWREWIAQGSDPENPPVLPC
jgi:hypothetical protein